MPDEEREQRRQRLAGELRQLRNKVEKLRGEVTFSDVIEDVTGAESSAPGVSEELGRLRARGYAFRGDLEQQLQEFRDEIGPVLRQIRQRIDRESDRLRDEARALSRAAGKISGNPLRNEGRIESLSAQVRGFDREVDEVKDGLEALSKPVLTKLHAVRDKVKDLHWTLDQFDAASFKMRPEERPVAVASATWEDAPGGEAPAGLLLLTDHRVYFEQKEERVTKRKFIFFAAETESLHKLLIDEPLGHLQSSDDATRGWVMKDQLLSFAWDRAAKAPQKTTFKLSSGTAKDWDGVVELLRSGDLSAYESEDASTARSDVVGGAPPAAAQHTVRYPEACVACAAPLTAPVKGQTAIVCGYCGTNHPVEFIEAGAE